jgi:hypothetical protein
VWESERTGEREKESEKERESREGSWFIIYLLLWEYCAKINIGARFPGGCFLTGIRIQGVLG